MIKGRGRVSIHIETKALTWPSVSYNGVKRPPWEKRTGISVLGLRDRALVELLEIQIGRTYYKTDLLKSDVCYSKILNGIKEGKRVVIKDYKGHNQGVCGALGPTSHGP